MRFVLEFAVLIGIVTLIVFIVKVSYAAWSKRRDIIAKKEEAMWQDLRQALSNNSKQRLEDCLILHNKNIPKEIKPIIQSRIDDLAIKESDDKALKIIHFTDK